MFKQDGWKEAGHASQHRSLPPTHTHTHTLNTQVRYCGPDRAPAPKSLAITVHQSSPKSKCVSNTKRTEDERGTARLVLLHPHWLPLGRVMRYRHHCGLINMFWLKFEKQFPSHLANKGASKRTETQQDYADISGPPLSRVRFEKVWVFSNVSWFETQPKQMD